MDAKTCPLEHGVPVVLTREASPFIGRRPHGVVVSANRFLYAGWRNGRRFPIGFDEQSREQQLRTLNDDKYKVLVALSGDREGEIIRCRLDHLEVNEEAWLGSIWLDRWKEG